MGVTAEIVHHFFRMLQGGLTVNHPWLMIKIRQKSFKNRRLLQLFDLSWKLKLPSLILPFQTIEKLTAEQGGEHLDRDVLSPAPSAVAIVSNMKRGSAQMAAVDAMP